MKRLCAKEALQLVPDHGMIGLGGGETIRYLAEYVKEAGKEVTVVTPSEATKKVCEELGIMVVPTEEVSSVEIAFDGCDQVDSDLNAYKSGGGIHTLEKIIARMSKEYVLLVDESKVVDKLGFDIPIVLEIVPEAIHYVTQQVEKLGGSVIIRDLHLLETYFREGRNLETLDNELKEITGVIETSLFYQVATKAVVAGSNGIRII